MAAMDRDPNILMSAAGTNGTLELLADRVRIRRKGGLAAASKGVPTETELPLRQIHSLKLKRPGRLSKGSLEVVWYGSREATRTFFGSRNADNIITFANELLADFERIKTAVEERARAARE